MHDCDDCDDMHPCDDCREAAELRKRDIPSIAIRTWRSYPPKVRHQDNPEPVLASEAFDL